MRKMKNPYKDIGLLITSIQKFMQRHKTFLSQQSKRISDYFEMTCYNDIVRFYQKNQFQTEIKNLNKDGSFLYKLSPTGYPENFSFFRVKKTYKNGKVFEYDIYHNVSVESSFNKGIYYTPDISIANANHISTDKSHYRGKKKQKYIKNTELQSFLEVKHLNPFPEVLFSFSGLVLELMKEIPDNNPSIQKPKHIAPCIVFSGGGNDHTNRIQSILMERYNINILFGLFYKPNQLFGKKLNKIGKRYRDRDAHH